MSDAHQIFPVFREFRGPSPWVHPQLGVGVEVEVNPRNNLQKLVSDNSHLNFTEGF